MVQCASTFRVTDYLGGCNGARIRWRGIIIVKLHDFNFNCLTPTLCRHSPGRDWAVNTGLDSALALLEPVKQEFGSPLSWADLIVLAGTTALEATMDQVTSTSSSHDIVCSASKSSIRRFVITEKAPTTLLRHYANQTAHSL